MQVWTSTHIDALVRHKACQSDDDALYPEDRGLGWSEEHGQALVDLLIWASSKPRRETRSATSFPTATRH